MELRRGGILVMKRKLVSAITLTLLLTSMLTLAFHVQPVRATGTVYIRADGSIDPPTAPISTLDNATYALYASTSASIWIERNNIVFDGNGYTVQGSDGIVAYDVSNVEIKRVNIKDCTNGIDAYSEGSCVIVSDNNISHCGVGISLYDCHAIVSRNNVAGSGTGLVLLYVAGCTVSGNNITNNKNGVWLGSFYGNNTFSGNNITNSTGTGLKVGNCNVTGNNVADNYWGIEIWGENVTLRGDNMTGNKYNLVLGEEVGDFINRCRTIDVDASNTVNGKPIHYLKNVQDVAVPVDAGYVALIDCTNMTVQNLDLTRNGQGMLLINTTSAMIAENDVTSNLDGIRMISCENNTVVGNNITANDGVGILIDDSRHSTVSGNNVANNYNGGLQLEDTSGSEHVVSGNKFVSNGNDSVSYKENGIYICHARATVFGNDVANNAGHGISLRNCSSGSTIFGNSITNNARCGLNLDYSSGTAWGNNVTGNGFGVFAGGQPASVFHNNFINNTVQAMSSGRMAQWDDGYPSGGNYWSDYADVDSNNDGIWDHPYVIPWSSEQDDYPLVNPWTPFSFPLDGLWTVSRRFGGYSNDWSGYHLGEDVLRSFEAPVFAPADGVVKSNSKHTGYGYAVIIEHELADGSFVCSILGHLREAGRIAVGSTVTKGQIVGYLSSLPEENGGVIHLHFGIRKGMYSEELDPDGKWRYRGYGPIDIVGSWCPPSAFIEYYNLNKQTPPSYDLTINTEGGGAFASSTSVFTLVFKTTLSLFSLHPWFLRWIGTDNDIPNPTTVTMNSPRTVTEVRSTEPPPTPPSQAELAKDVLGKVYRTAFNNFATKGWEGGKFVEYDGVDYLDCSGLVFWSYNKAHDSKKYTWIYDGANAQYGSNFMMVVSESELLPGDALFFDWNHDDYIDHVAMYVGEDVWTGVIPTLEYYTTGGDLRQTAYQPIVTTKEIGSTLYDEYAYNVVHASGDAGHSYGVRPDTVSRLKVLDGFVGFRRFTGPKVGVEIKGNSPIDLVVTDPDGFTITKEIGEIPGVLYYSECDIDGDGESEDIVTAPERKVGDYLITIVPELGALPTDVFSLEASANGTTILLADYALISEIPADPYIITQNETTIMLRNINIALTNITLSKNVVGQGHSLSINTTVQNQGTLEETLNVTLLANAIPIASQAVSLASGDFATLTFTWNTSGFAKGNYTISAYVEPILGETYTADNTCMGGTVRVGIPGDVDPVDGYVGIDDIFAIALRFGTEPGGPPNSNGYCYSPTHDINGDNYIGIDDIYIAASHFGQEENP
jgi:parallel beta-helix repeat protein